MAKMNYLTGLWDQDPIDCMVSSLTYQKLKAALASIRAINSCVSTTKLTLLTRLELTRLHSHNLRHPIQSINIKWKILGHAIMALMANRVSSVPPSSYTITQEVSISKMVAASPRIVSRSTAYDQKYSNPEDSNKDSNVSSGALYGCKTGNFATVSQVPILQIYQGQNMQIVQGKLVYSSQYDLKQRRFLLFSAAFIRWPCLP